MRFFFWVSNVGKVMMLSFLGGIRKRWCELLFWHFQLVGQFWEFEKLKVLFGGFKAYQVYVSNWNDICDGNPRLTVVNAYFKMKLTAEILAIEWGWKSTSRPSMNIILVYWVLWILLIKENGEAFPIDHYPSFKCMQNTKMVIFWLYVDAKPLFELWVAIFWVRCFHHISSLQSFISNIWKTPNNSCKVSKL